MAENNDLGQLGALGLVVASDPDLARELIDEIFAQLQTIARFDYDAGLLIGAALSEQAAEELREALNRSEPWTRGYYYGRVLAPVVAAIVDVMLGSRGARVAAGMATSGLRQLADRMLLNPRVSRLLERVRRHLYHEPGPDLDLYPAGFPDGPEGARRPDGDAYSVPRSMAGEFRAARALNQEIGLTVHEPGLHHYRDELTEAMQLDDLRGSNLSYGVDHRADPDFIVERADGVWEAWDAKTSSGGTPNMDTQMSNVTKAANDGQARNFVLDMEDVTVPDPRRWAQDMRTSALNWIRNSDGSYWSNVNQVLVLKNGRLHRVWP